MQRCKKKAADANRQLGILGAASLSVNAYLVVKNFLKSAAHQHKDAQVRLGYVKDIDASAEQAQSILSTLARNDDDVLVRLAAIGKLDDLNVLRELLNVGSDEDERLSDAAEKRLLEKLTEGQVSDIAVRALLDSHAARLAVPIASHSSVSEQRELAMQSIDDEASFLSIVQHTRYHDTRLSAALKLTHHDALHTALNAVRSKDKVVAKQLQQRLDTQAAAEAALIANRHAISTAVQNAQTLNEGLWTPQHGGRLQALKEKWARFDSKDTQEHDTQFSRSIEQAEEKLLAYNKSLSAGQEQGAPDDATAAALTDGDGKAAEVAGDDAQATPDAPAVVVVDDPSLVPVLQLLADSPITELPSRIKSRNNPGSEENSGNDSEHVQKLLAYAQAVAVLFDPPYELNKARPAALKQRLKRVESLLDVKTLLPGIEVSTHTYYTELQSHANALTDRVGKAQQESADRVKATHRQFSALSAIIKEGKWGPANSMMRRLHKKLDAMEPAERSTLNDKLARAEKQLVEMADWQDFAARPKLEALCDSMEALPAQELQPEALAKQVRELQGQWKSLGISRASNELWSRFKTAGDTAYEPCKVWFEEKQGQRQQKLDAKVALCVALEADHASVTDNPDWKLVVRTVNNAKREWTRNRIADRKPDKALEARFSAALKPFEAALAEQYDANAVSKQELVDKAQALAEGDITQHSANQAKSLLSAWKLVGIMRRKEDQVLWEVFNSHLGTIFKHQHKVEREKLRAGLEHVYRAKDITKRLKTLSRADSVDEAEVQTLATEFQSLAEFPERDKKFLLRDFRQAMDAVSRVQENASKRRKQAGHEEARRLLELCERLEQAVEEPQSATATLVEDVTHAWESTDAKVAAELDGILKARRDAALAHLEASTQPDYDANETIRRELLIRMEVAASVDTPAEDKSRRMKYQLENLQQGMTSTGMDDARQVLKALEKQWLAAGPVRTAIRDALNSRYLKAFKR